MLYTFFFLNVLFVPFTCILKLVTKSYVIILEPKDN